MASHKETDGKVGPDGDRLLRASVETGPRVLRSKEVCRRCGLSRVTIWRLERAGKFPKRRYLTAHVVGWLEHEITEWIISRTRWRGE